MESGEYRMDPRSHLRRLIGLRSSSHQTDPFRQRFPAMEQPADVHAGRQVAGGYGYIMYARFHASIREEKNLPT